VPRLDGVVLRNQQGIDTATPAGKAMFQMMGVFAEFERSMIVERVPRTSTVVLGVALPEQAGELPHG
jgi:hypothetical protein